jgi:hypothetical protein
VKFCFKLGKTASEKREILKTVSGDNAMVRTQTCEWFCRFKRGSNIKSMLVIFYDFEGIVHQEFFPPAALLSEGFEASEGASLPKTSGTMAEPELVASP